MLLAPDGFSHPIPLPPTPKGHHACGVVDTSPITVTFMCMLLVLEGVSTPLSPLSPLRSSRVWRAPHDPERSSLVCVWVAAPGGCPQGQHDCGVGDTTSIAVALCVCFAGAGRCSPLPPHRVLGSGSRQGQLAMPIGHGHKQAIAVGNSNRQCEHAMAIIKSRMPLQDAIGIGNQSRQYRQRWAITIAVGNRHNRRHHP